MFGGPDPVVLETASGPVEIMAEIAATPDQQVRGLMWRDSLDENAGMLFQYSPPQPTSIWMRNTLIGLDILYISEDGRIAKIVANAQPGSERSLYSDFPVTGVLEIAAGRAAALELRPGDTVRHPMFGNTDPEPEPVEDTSEAQEETPDEAIDAGATPEDDG